MSKEDNSKEAVEDQKAEAQGADLHDYRSAPTHDIAARTNKSQKDRHEPHADPETYKKMYQHSIENPKEFWDKVCTSFLNEISNRELRHRSHLLYFDSGVVRAGFVPTPPLRQVSPASSLQIPLGH